MLIKEFIDKTGIPFRELARRTGIHYNTLMNLYYGRNHRFLASTAYRLSLYFHPQITLEMLCKESFNEEEKRPKKIRKKTKLTKQKKPEK